MRCDLLLYLDANKASKCRMHSFLVPFVVLTSGLVGFVHSSANGQPFSLPNGFASGDTRQTSTVLWARSTTLGNVMFDYSTFADFRIIDGYETTTVVDVNQPVKVELRGLTPATQYYCRVTDAQNNTLVGRFRTPPATGTRTGLRFGASGDWQQAPPFLSLKNAPAGTEGSGIVKSTPVSAFEVVTGPIAFFDGLFGPSTVNLAASSGVLSPFLKAFYDRLPVAPDTDSAVNDKDDFLKSLINTQLKVLDYDPIGLNENLSGAEGLIDAELFCGDYLACHTFGWAEFEIDPNTQDLLVTVHGVDAHSEADLVADPNGVVNRTPRVVSQFIVHPKKTNLADFDKDGDVDLRDYTIFASSWLAESGQPGWNPASDIAYPQDGVINTIDLCVLLQNWLLGVE